MYIRLSTQRTCKVVLGLVLLLIAPCAVFAALRGVWPLVVALSALSGVLLLACTPYLIFRCLPASRSRYHRNVLTQDLEFEEVAEIQSLQFVSVFAPDRVAPGRETTLVLVLQSTHERPSRVQIELKPGRLETRSIRHTVTFSGGDTWCLAVPIRVPEGLKDGEHNVRYTLAIRHPNGIGPRVIRAEGLPAARSKRSQSDIVEVAAAAPAVPPASDGLWCLWGDGRPKPDLSPLEPILAAC